jgi:hypothetical protein
MLHGFALGPPEQRQAKALRKCSERAEPEPNDSLPVIDGRVGDFLQGEYYGMTLLLPLCASPEIEDTYISIRWSTKSFVPFLSIRTAAPCAHGLDVVHRKGGEYRNRRPLMRSSNQCPDARQRWSTKSAFISCLPVRKMRMSPLIFAESVGSHGFHRLDGFSNSSGIIKGSKCQNARRAAQFSPENVRHF